jgi:hypothetical protein
MLQTAYGALTVGLDVRPGSLRSRPRTRTMEAGNAFGKLVVVT